MTQTEIEKRRERARLLAEAREIHNKAKAAGRDRLSADDHRRFDEIMARRQELLLDIEEGRDAEVREPLAGYPDPAEDGPSWWRREQRADQGERFGEARAIGLETRMADIVPSRPLPDGIRADELDLGRFVRGVALGDWRGAEGERRAMSVGDATAGGYLVPQPLAMEVIDLARARTVLLSAGARTVPMTSSTLTLGTLAGDVTAYGPLAENERITPSDASFGGVKMQARTLAALTPMSMEVVEDAQNLDQLVRTSIAEAIAHRLDLHGLRGQHPDEIGGIRTWPGVGGFDVGGAAIGWAHVIDGKTALMTANAPDDRLACVLSTDLMGDFEKLTDGEGRYLGIPPALDRVRFLPTSAVPTDLGSGGNETELYVGDFRNLYIGMRTELRIEVDVSGEESTTGLGFATKTVWIRGVMRADVAIVRPSHFYVLQGITGLA